MQHDIRPHQPRGYVLMVVIVMGIVLASLASILLYSTARDRAEAKQQAASVRAVYASEAAVSVGVEQLRALLEENTAPSPAELTTVENDTRTSSMTAMPGVTFPTISVRYYDPIQNIVSDTPTSTSNDLVTITSGPNRGLRAQQTPIQVLASARVDNATASVADAIRVDLIPVFQFAIFFDGDLEFQRPAPMDVAGRVHTNGDLYLSNGNRVNFLSTVTSARRVHSHSAVATSLTVGSGATGTYFTRLPGTTLVAIANNLPRADAAQRTYLEATYGVAGGLQDITTGVEPLSIPLRMSSSQTCLTNATCGVGRSCVKVRVSDPAGVCTNNVTSRPNKCANGTTEAEFAQSLAVELIKRPARDYANNTVTAPYRLPFDRTTSIAPGAAQSGAYTADFGPRPALAAGAALATDIWQEKVLRRVPRLTSTAADDDPGAVVDRMYWKAHIRIVDGIWYRQGSTTPIFDPERDAPGTATPVPTDLNHAFARVLRYAWWWDVRENRVYCEASTGVNVNCVTDGNEYQRGAQVRATDFDAAAFMALLSRADARARLFPSGSIPSGGVIVYLSETYDPKYEDANSRLDRAANVRNLLNFPITHNHVTAAQMLANSSPTPCAAAACGALALLQRRPAVATFTSPILPPPVSAHEVGWFPENLWGQLAGTNFESMTRPPAGNDLARSRFYQNPPPNGGKNSSACAIPGTDFTASRRPATRPTLAAMTTPSFAPPCLQVGAQPLGPENAVRIIRAQTLPTEGFTFVTDNRLYLHGDVNVRRDSTVVSGTFATSQDIGGKYAFIADSVTIQSEAFDDRRRQADPTATNSNFLGFHQAPGAWTGPLAWSAVTSPRPPFSAVAPITGSIANICQVVHNVSAFETRINASLLMGDVPACLNSSDTMGNASGGVNNFPRFVEQWTNVPLVINGSMVGLFRAERGNARFLNAQTDNTGTVRRNTSGSPWSDTAAQNICDYRPPVRRWTFDQVLLTGIDRLPPGTPRVVANDRLRWVRR